LPLITAVAPHETRSAESSARDSVRAHAVRAAAKAEAARLQSVEQ